MMVFNHKFTPLLTLTVFMACSSESPDTGGTADEEDGSGGSVTAPATGGTDAGSGGTGHTPVVVDVNATGGVVELGPFECMGMATGEEPLIDDNEDLNKFIPFNEGRNGWWEAFDDEEGTYDGKINYETGEGEGVDGSNARCVDVEGFTTWGAVLSVSLGFPRCMYDASEYAGVCFEAKGTLRKGDLIDFSVNTADTLGTEDGGRCDQTNGDDNCERFWHYKTPIRAEADGVDAEPGETLLDEEYRTFCFTWEDLQQDSDAPTPFDKNVQEIVQFEWKWGGGFDTGEVDDMGDAIPGSTDGSLCLDDIRFMTFDEVPDPPMGGFGGSL
jgi:hypothetical protein